MSENLEEYTKKVIEEFEVISKDAERVQREVLKSILEENASAEYLQSLGLNGRTDPESFKECVPLVTHPDLVPYIQRILDGDKSSILTGKPITAMSLSSGTTQGKSKYIPWNETYMDGLKEMFHISFAYRNRYSTSFLLFQSHCYFLLLFLCFYPLGSGIVEAQR
ncbi:putative GH3 family protein [Lupinus albus]|uniref:Putative GH3 family protein n=1 Tax=Lupinus albus TaxID=3870 RepID=A0A6A4PW04_LUPAL|nr:putative GH3 family protein [Lupinus albus]